MRASWLLLFVTSLGACSASSNSFSGSGSGSGSSGGGGSGSGDFGSSTGGSSGGNGAGGGDGGVPSGVLTAGAWDDNRNYDFFVAYLQTKSTLGGAPPISSADRDAAHALFGGTQAAKSRLDVAIVIDTTGSMGDEAEYLKSEFQNISGAIASQFPNADQHWALVAYRDRPDTDPGDAYVTKSWDFTSDLGSFGGSLDGISAGNGGDYQEAPELGLAAMNQLAWRSDADVARVAFWVGDAPQHDDRGADIAKTFQDARQKNVHLYPVAASGADDLLELTMRSGAQLTGGRYLFLTDDSGIGDPHEVPSIPCFFVTKLAKQIVRMVSIELSGTYREPDSADIIRTGGNPSSGACALPGDAGTVSVF